MNDSYLEALARIEASMADPITLSWEGEKKVYSCSVRRDDLALLLTKPRQIASLTREGMVWVPVEPTPEMYCAGDEAIIEHLNGLKVIKSEDTPAVDCWKAMLSVLPDQAGGKV
jgi:hypothetical protein